MPNGLDLVYFGDSEFPVRKPNYAMSDKKRFDEFLKRQGSGGFLFGQGYSASFYRSPNVPSTIAFYPDEKKGESFCELAGAILRFFPARGATYGYACASEERRARNLVEYDLWGRGTKSTTHVGTDIRRYIPGLYWLNYFANAYRELHPIDLEAIARETGGVLYALGGGYLLRLYRRPSDWRMHDDVVRRCMDANPHIFSRSQVDLLPPGLSPREYMERSGKLGREWP